MNLINLQKRIKKNEGYSQKPYKDLLGYYTIGYGHLLRKEDSKYFTTTFNKKHFDDLFIIDFYKAVNEYKKFFHRKIYKKKEKELLIEMIFQLGPKGVLKFKKMLFFLEKGEKYMTCLEMMDSLWYKQTPKRVLDLINNYVGK